MREKTTETSQFPGAPFATECVAKQRPEIIEAAKKGSLALWLYGNTYQEEHTAATLRAEIDAAARFRANGYVKSLPPFSEVVGSGNLVYARPQMSDVLYRRRSAADAKAGLSSASEAAALKELRAFLKVFYESEKQAPEVNVNERLRHQAEYMYEHTAFITYEYLDEAIAGIAAAWKTRLESGERLCVLAGQLIQHKLQFMSGPCQKELAGRLKSCEYITERILWHFSADELCRYGTNGQLTVGTVQEAVENAKMQTEEPVYCIVDDWIISGAQMDSVINSLCRALPKISKNNIECWFVAAPKAVIENAVTSPLYRQGVTSKAYFLAPDIPHDMATKLHSTQPVISGSHSATDYGFSKELGSMKTLLNGSGDYENNIGVPLLARLVPPYRRNDIARDDLATTAALKKYNAAWRQSAQEARGYISSAEIAI